MDRKAGEQFRAVYREIVDVARASARFLTRAVRYLAGEAGIRWRPDATELASGAPPR